MAYGEDGWIPALWDGSLALLTHASTAPVLLGALVRLLARSTEGTDEDRPLVRALVSASGPMADRVWFDCERRGRAASLRSVVVDLKADRWDFERSGLAPWCAALRHDYRGSFDVDPAEFLERCIPHYHGFLHAWTERTAARDHYKTWPRERQACFEHEYLLYAANDVREAQRSRRPADASLQAAADWLRSKRRYVFRWTVVMRDEPIYRPDWLSRIEQVLMADIQALRAFAPTDLEAARFTRLLDEFVSTLYVPARADAWEELLQRLECDEGRMRAIRVLCRTRALAEQLTTFPNDDLAKAVARLSAKTDEAVRWSC